MWWSDWFGGYGFLPWMIFGPAMMLIFIAVCVALMFLFMRGAHGRHGGGRAIEILKERYARGEIDQVEFEERRRLLEA